MKMSVNGIIHLLGFLLILSLFLRSSRSTRYSNTTESSVASCSRACIPREELGNLTLGSIKQDILSKLGLASLPVIPDRVKARLPPLEQLLRPHRQQSHTGGIQGDQPVRHGPGSASLTRETPPITRDNFFTGSNKVVALSRNSSKSPAGVAHLPILHFHFADSPIKDNVESAILWMYIKGMPRNSSSETASPTININVYNVTSSGSNLRSYLSDTIEGPQEPGTWITLDVTDIVSEWYAKPSQNMGLYMNATDAQGNNYFVRDAPQKGSFIEVLTSEKLKRRAKRDVGLNCDESSNENRCCRYPLEVSFEDFGWDWVIAPKKYDAHFCAGECPYAFLQQYAYTHVLTQMSNKPKGAGPCCAPRRMGSISMLYFTAEYTIMMDELPNMVVESCGCF